MSSASRGGGRFLESALHERTPSSAKASFTTTTSCANILLCPNRSRTAVLAICDTKDRGADYAFLPIFYQYGQDYYLEDCICDNGAPETVEARILNALLFHKVQMARFESNSAGGRIAQRHAKTGKGPRMGAATSPPATPRKTRKPKSLSTPPG